MLCLREGRNAWGRGKSTNVVGLRCSLGSLICGSIKLTIGMIIERVQAE